MGGLFQLLLPPLVSFCIVNWVFPVLLKISLEKNITDRPNNRKLQTVPVPVLGGIVVFFGILAASLVATCLDPHVDFLLPVFLSMGIMTYMGFMDDSLVLSARVRVLAEMLVIGGIILATGMSLDHAHGLFGIAQLPWWLSVPLTLLAGVGIINAINMIDGINGLASGLSLLCTCVFGYFFLRVGDVADAILAFSTATALIPFLLHNVFGKTSKMFLGDTGTMMLGVLLTWFVIVCIDADSPLMDGAFAGNFHPVPMCLAVLSLPVFDTLRVALLRICRGYSPFRPDKTHLHHVFIALGFSHSFTSLLEIVMDALVIALWAVCYGCGFSAEVQLLVVVASSLILYIGQYFLLAYHADNKTPVAGRIWDLSRKTHFGHTPWWLRFQAWLDRISEKNQQEG